MVMQQKEPSLSSSMNARILGSGTESIVLAHGYGANQSIWDKIVPCLVDKYKLLLFDWPFAGTVLSKQDEDHVFDGEKSSCYDAFADDLIGLVDEMKMESCVVVSHSMSGMIACIASVKRPELFKRIVLVGASPRYINDHDYEGGFKTSEIDDMMKNIETDFQTWSSNFASLVVSSSDPDSATMFTNCLQSMPPEVALSVAKTVFYSDQRHVLEKVSTPCTIVQTRSDIVVPNSVAYYMKDKIKGTSSVEIIDIDGHFPQLTAHQKLVDVIYRALEN